MDRRSFFGAIVGAGGGTAIAAVATPADPMPESIAPARPARTDMQLVIRVDTIELNRAFCEVQKLAADLRYVNEARINMGLEPVEPILEQIR